MYSKNHKHKVKESMNDLLTRMMHLIAATPDDAITFAQFGTRLNNVGTMASALWSYLLPRIVDSCLCKFQQMDFEQNKHNIFFVKVKAVQRNKGWIHSWNTKVLPNLWLYHFNHFVLNFE